MCQIHNKGLLQQLTKFDLFAPPYGGIERNFSRINTINHIYFYIDQILFPIIFNERTRQNGSYIQDPRRRYYVNSNSRVLGGVRFRQGTRSSVIFFLFIRFIFLFLCCLCCFFIAI